MSERELETEQNCNILTPTLLAITAFLSRSPGLLNRGPGDPASLGYVPQSSISPTRLIPNWLNFLCPELYNSSTPTFFFWASQIALIQPVHGQGYILIILDRMHLLFTQVHFLFWLPGRVGGQYATWYCRWNHAIDVIKEKKLLLGAKSGELQFKIQTKVYTSSWLLSRILGLFDLQCKLLLWKYSPPIQCDYNLDIWVFLWTCACLVKNIISQWNLY